MISDSGASGRFPNPRARGIMSSSRDNTTIASITHGQIPFACGSGVITLLLTIRQVQCRADFSRWSGRTSNNACGNSMQKYPRGLFSPPRGRQSQRLYSRSLSPTRKTLLHATECRIGRGFRPLAPKTPCHARVLSGPVERASGRKNATARSPVALTSQRIDRGCMIHRPFRLPHDESCIRFLIRAGATARRGCPPLLPFRGTETSVPLWGSI